MLANQFYLWYYLGELNGRAIFRKKIVPEPTFNQALLPKIESQLFAWILETGTTTQDRITMRIPGRSALFLYSFPSSAPRPSSC